MLGSSLTAAAASSSGLMSPALGRSGDGGFAAGAVGFFDASSGFFAASVGFFSGVCRFGFGGAGLLAAGGGVAAGGTSEICAEAPVASITQQIRLAKARRTIIPASSLRGFGLSRRCRITLPDRIIRRRERRDRACLIGPNEIADKD